MTRRLKLSVLGLTVLALMAFAPSAFASTITKTGTDIVWAAAPSMSNSLDISDGPPDTVYIDTTGDPATITGPDAGDCTTGDGGQTVTCTNTTGGHITANAGDGSDSVYAGGLSDHAITINGEAGDDSCLYGGHLNDTISGGDGNDCVYGYGGDDTVSGDAGNDSVYGDNSGMSLTGNDTVTGGDGRDNVHGGPGNDSVDAGNGDDNDVGGGPGDDTVTGGDGNDDNITGGPGVDNVSGGNGDDYLWSFNDGAADTFSGGAGQDTLEYDSDGLAANGDSVQVSLDGQANDGDTPGAGSPMTADNTENFGSDFEMINIYSDAPTNATGDNGATTLNIRRQNSNNPPVNDTVDMGGGADSIYTNDGDDTVSSVDGFPDTINCGTGTDTANIDQFDTTYNCENVNRTEVASAYAVTEDAPPSVSWVAPTPGSHGIPSGTPTRLEVAAADDKGIAQVVFQVGSRTVCTVTAPPYVCSYQPNGTEVGRNTLVAIALDTGGQTATALNEVIVPRFAATSLTYKTTPKRDASAPFRFTTTGKLNLPATVAAALGCKGGLVSVQFRAGKKTISNRRVGLKSNCSFKSAVTFKIPARLHPKSLNVHVTFLGNQTVNPRKARVGKVKTA